MKTNTLIKIKDYPSIYYEYDEQIEKYLSNGILDMGSKEYKTANKNKALKDFSFMIRVSKVVDHKQKQKKKRFRFSEIKDGLTIAKALKELVGEPEKLQGQIKSDEELQQAKIIEDQIREDQDHAARGDSLLTTAWDKFYKHKTTGAKTSKWKDSTARTYKSFYNAWIRDTPLGNTALSKLKKRDFTALIDKVAQKRTMRTATTAIEVLKPCLDWYFDEYEIDRRNPVPGKKDYKFENKRIVDVSIEQTRALFKAIDAYEFEQFRDVFKWLLTGRRRGEVIGLRIADINTTKKTVMIGADINKAGVSMQYKLRPELEKTIPKESESIYLFESPRIPGQPIHVDTLGDHWSEIKKIVGGTFELNHKEVLFTELHLHDLRHIMAGIMKKAGVPEETRGKALGHKRAGITERYGLNYYGDIDTAVTLYFDIVQGRKSESTKWKQ